MNKTDKAKGAATKTSDDQFDIKEIYTPLSVAKKEIWKRWNDRALRQKVEDFLGEVPEVFKKEPVAALFRFIATPNFEFLYFLDISKETKLNRVYIEFLSDKFCTRNPDKVHLAKICCLLDEKRKDGNIIVKKIINIPKNENKELKFIKTKWSDSLVNFHHKIFDKYYNKKDVKKFDISVFKKNRENALDIYVKLFSLFLRNGILFENYINKDFSGEKKFTKNIVIPALKIIKKKFGIIPLVVPLLPIKDEERKEWMWYKKDIIGEIKQGDA